MSSKNIKFVLIGAKATGKTIFLACLEHGTKEKISAIGDTTREYINEKWNLLNQKDTKTDKRICKLPPTPPIFKPLQFMYQHDMLGKINFSIHDYDGNFTETITISTDKTEEELEIRIKHLESKLYLEDKSTNELTKQELDRYRVELNTLRTQKQRDELLQSIKEKPKGIFFFLPYEMTTERFQSFSQNIGKFIELAQFSNKSKSPIPACIVITKWDDADGFKKENEKQLLREYLESNEYLQKVLNIVENYFEYVEIIPVSSCESYNLTAPFDFGLEKTFDQWYKRALELKEEKKFEKLVIYMANRYEDMQFVKKYDFKALYDEAQNEYMNIVEKEFFACEKYEDREKYLHSVTPLFKTKLELLDPLKKALKQEQRHIKFKKVKNIVLSVITITALGIGLLEYKMKRDVDEAYTSIKQRYEKKVLYPRIEADIQNFLENYKSENFLYALANVPKKRNDIIKMRDDLKVQYTTWIDKQLNDILTNNKLTADEKRLKLKELRSQADTLDQRKIDEMMENLGLSINKEKWLASAKDCLKTCEGEIGKDRIASLVEQVDQGEVVLDDTVKVLLGQLTQKKVSIKKESDLKNVLIKLEEQHDANNLTAYLSGLSSEMKVLPQVKEKILIQYISFLSDLDIGQILNLISSEDDSSPESSDVDGAAIPDEIVTSERFKNALSSVLDDKYKDELIGSCLLSKIKLFNRKEDIYNILKDIKKKISQNQLFDKIKNSIKDISIDELNDDLFTGFSTLTENQQSSIQKQLDTKLTGFVEEIYNGLPNDESQTDEIKMKIEEIENIDGFPLTNINYTYSIPDNIRTKIDEKKQKNNEVKDIMENGIRNVRVILVGKEGNYIGFGCENWSVDNTDIIIKGFNLDLQENDNTECADNEMIYPQYISLKAERYDLIVSEDDWVSPDPKHATIYFSIEDLIKIKNNDSVTKSIDGDKLQLIFRQ